VSGDYMLSSPVIDLLYKSISFADCKVITPEEYLQVRHAVDELAQTLTDGTTLPAPDDVSDDPIDAARDRYQAAEAAYHEARAERVRARAAYVEVARKLNPDDARAELAIRIGSKKREPIDGYDDGS
jgi:hypothetical protein